MKDTEIEIRVKVQKTKKFVSCLNKKAKFVGQFTQVDEYYTPKHRDFTKVRPIREWLRVRKSNKGASVTYKNWIYGKSGISFHCDEYESKIAKPNQLKKILTVLNFKPLCKVDKKRTVYMYGKYEICLDKVVGLGSFVEMEYKGRKKVKVDDVVNDMVSFLKEQNCGKIQRNNEGYPFMLMFPQEVKYEEL